MSYYPILPESNNDISLSLGEGAAELPQEGGHGRHEAEEDL